jgi:hypothetical protein
VKTVTFFSPCCAVTVAPGTKASAARTEPAYWAAVKARGPRAAEIKKTDMAERMEST